MHLQCSTPAVVPGIIVLCYSSNRCMRNITGCAQTSSHDAPLLAYLAYVCALLPPSFRVSW
jgi:hypothetical protein